MMKPHVAHLPPIRRRLLPLATLAFLFLFITSVSTLISSPVVFAAPPVTLQDNQDETPSLNEQSIYIPYDKLKSVFEREGRGVFIPYEEFQKLWEAARKNTERPKPAAAPLGALITDIESVASLGKEVVAVDAVLKIELIKKGWHRIPLRLNGAAIRSATIEGEEAKIVGKNNQFELLIKQDDDEPKTVTLNLSYARSLTKTGAQSSVEFNAPQAPVNRWKIRTGESDVDVKIDPMIATSEQPADDDPNLKEILAFVGTAPSIKLTWTPKSEGAAGLEALISSNVQSQVRVNSGVVRTTSNIGLDVSRSEIRKVAIAIPLDQKVVSVFDRNIKKWNVTKEDQIQKIDLELFEPSIGKMSVVVELEKFIEDVSKVEITAPQVSVVDASRSSGILLVQVGDGLRVEPKSKDGLLQLDQSEIASRSNEKWNLGFRYSNLPHDLTLAVETIEPQIDVQQLVEYVIRPRRIDATISARFNVREAGVFQLQMQIPAQFTIKDIISIATATEPKSKEIRIDSFYRDEENPETVVVTLSRKALGNITLVAMLDRTADDIDLDSPKDEATAITVNLPKTKSQQVKFSEGNFVVYAPESLRLNATSTKGLRKIGFDQIFHQHQRTVAGDVRPVLAYSFANSDASVGLQARRRKPQVDVEQIVSVSIQTGAAKFVSTFFWDVKYSGVKEFRIDVPKTLVDRLRLKTDGIVQQRYVPQPDNVSPDHIALKLTGENEFFGNKTIQFLWEQEIKNLTLGQTVDVAVERLQPMGVDRSTGKIVLMKSETIDVRPTESASGLRPIDPQTDLGERAKIVDASMAFEFAGEWSLELSASRFELQELKQTSISRALVQAVVLRQDELSVQCLYKIRSVRQRIAIQMPTGFDAETSFDDQPVRINNVPVTPERGGNDLIFIPLIGQESDKPFLLELRYNIAGNADQIELPEFTEDPALQKCYLAVYVPYEKALVNVSGRWTDEAIGDNQTSLLQALDPWSKHWKRLFRRSDSNADQYLQWICEGTPVSVDASRKFEVDGRSYVFSAIRPEPGTAGSLELFTMNLWMINVLVFGTILALGFLMMRATFFVQIAMALFVVGGLLLTGIVAPLVAEHLLGLPLIATGAVVLAACLFGNLNRWRKQYTVAIARRDAARTTSPPDNEVESETASPSTPSTDSLDSSDSETPDSNADEGGAK